VAGGVLGSLGFENSAGAQTMAAVGFSDLRSDLVDTIDNFAVVAAGNTGYMRLVQLFARKHNVLKSNLPRRHLTALTKADCFQIQPAGGLNLLDSVDHLRQILEAHAQQPAQ
jgi:hypothetical protein